MSQSIRLATPEDVPAVARLVREAYAPYVARIGREPGPMGDDYAGLVAAGRVRVSEDAARGLCGVLVLVPQEDAMLLDNIAVAPGAQGLGVGRQLLTEAEAVARTAGFERMRLYTHEKMVENFALYTRIGYRETHRVSEKGFDRVYMEKPLF